MKPTEKREFIEDVFDNLEELEELADTDVVRE